ncbi:protein of unknown function [Xenorhabdus bovienii]|uniref:Uncharacterized protein n=1 Tax=Xenorhabdus bovienii TaxID=40576 RepID=A0A0B6XGP4_XENBV|nr:protein of unknown function [Xenorhabdus bovienii]
MTSDILCSRLLKMTVGARDMGNASNALSELTNITLLPLDLSDINSVRALAARGCTWFVW